MTDADGAVLEISRTVEGRPCNDGKEAAAAAEGGGQSAPCYYSYRPPFCAEIITTQKEATAPRSPSQLSSLPNEAPLGVMLRHSSATACCGSGCGAAAAEGSMEGGTAPFQALQLNREILGLMEDSGLDTDYAQERDNRHQPFLSRDERARSSPAAATTSAGLYQHLLCLESRMNYMQGEHNAVRNQCRALRLMVQQQQQWIRLLVQERESAARYANEDGSHINKKVTYKMADEHSSILCAPMDSARVSGGKQLPRDVSPVMSPCGSRAVSGRGNGGNGNGGGYVQRLRNRTLSGGRLRPSGRRDDNKENIADASLKIMADGVSTPELCDAGSHVTAATSVASNLHITLCDVDGTNGVTPTRTVTATRSCASKQQEEIRCFQSYQVRDHSVSTITETSDVSNVGEEERAAFAGINVSGHNNNNNNSELPVQPASRRATPAGGAAGRASSSRRLPTTAPSLASTTATFPSSVTPSDMTTTATETHTSSGLMRRAMPSSRRPLVTRAQQFVANNNNNSTARATTSSTQDGGTTGRRKVGGYTTSTSRLAVARAPNKMPEVEKSRDGASGRTPSQPTGRRRSTDGRLSSMRGKQQQQPLSPPPLGNGAAPLQ